MTIASRVLRCSLLCLALGALTLDQVYALQRANARVVTPAAQLAMTPPSPRATAAAAGEAHAQRTSLATTRFVMTMHRFDTPRVPHTPQPNLGARGTSVLQRTVAEARSSMDLPSWLGASLFTRNRFENVNRRRMLEHLEPRLRDHDTLYCLGVTIAW